MSNNICQSVQSLSSSLAMRRMFSRAAFAAILFGTNSFACTSSCFFGFRSQDSSRGKRCWIGRSKKDFPALSRTARTTSSFPLIIWSTTPSFHLFLFLSSPLIITTSPCFRSWSLVLCFKLWRSRNPRRYSFDHLSHSAFLHLLTYFALFLRTTSSISAISSSGTTPG